MVLGDADKQPTPAELDRMKALVREAMEQGAVGVSTSLQYAAGAVCHDRGADRARNRGRQVRRHLRDAHALRRRRVSSTRSTRRSASAATRTFPSRSGTSRRRASSNWGRMKDIVAQIDEARRAASTSPPTPTRIRRGSTRCRRSSRPGRTTAATRQLLARLKDPQTRARIKREMQTPGGGLGQRVAGDSRARGRHRSASSRTRS